METEMNEVNKCPICGSETKQDKNIIFCECCGFNINKKEKDTEPVAR